MNIRIALLGHGRMGTEIRRLIGESDDLSLNGIWARNAGNREAPRVSGDLAAVLSGADVAIDFTLPDAASAVIAATRELGVPLVSGVSGLTDPLLRAMADAALDIPILYDRNMSLGVAVLQRLVRLAGAALGPPFRAEIHETHHVHKIDAPSGTALKLGETLAASRGQVPADVFHYDESGASATPDGHIRFEVSRRGEIPGQHTVVLQSDDEILSLTHEVTDRRVFAAGAVRAARWICRQPPGLYSMQDLVADND